MSMSRWEATTQWTGRKWTRIKEWSREKAKSRPVRWGVSILSGASLASAMHEFIPMQGAWVVFNVLATGVTFAISARLTSHGLSSQEEAPEKTKQLVQITTHDTLQIIVDQLNEQLNENVNRNNHNTALILKRVSNIEKKAAHVLQRFQEPQALPVEVKDDIELGLARTESHLAAIAALPLQLDIDSDDDAREAFGDESENNEIMPLLAIRIEMPIEAKAETKEESSSIDCSYLTNCWRKIPGGGRMRLFAATESTELTRQHLQVYSSDDAEIFGDLPSPPGPMRVETYQSDLEAGMQRQQFY
jgi:hypothetical protein